MMIFIGGSAYFLRCIEYFITIRCFAILLLQKVFIPLLLSIENSAITRIIGLNRGDSSFNFYKLFIHQIPIIGGVKGTYSPSNILGRFGLLFKVIILYLFLKLLQETLLNHLVRLYLPDEKEGNSKPSRKMATKVMSKLLPNGLYLFLMTNQTRFQMVNRIINQNKGKLNLHELQNRFGSKLTSKMIRKYEFTNNKFLKKYSLIQRRYQKGINRPNLNEWLENQRKLFIWFSIIFCNHLHRNYDELSQKQWEVLSHLFFAKSIILLQYETKQIQRNPQRVNWAKRQQSILLQAVRNGKLSQWNEISRTIFFETKGKYYKTSKQCRQHWFNHLDKSKKKGDWSKSEDLLLLQTVKTEGRKWSTITHLLGERRTQHMVKNRYNSLINGIIRSEQADISEESIIGNLIAKLQAQNQENPQQRSQNQQQDNMQNQSNGGNLELQGEEQQSADPQEIHNNQAQINDNQDEIHNQAQNDEAVIIPQANVLMANQTWNGIMNNQTVQSPYFFVFSPFSFSSTASPYINSYQSWSGWTNPAHQTLFFNPQCDLNSQLPTSANLVVKQQHE